MDNVRATQGTPVKYSYQTEKFSTARRCLMLPPSGGEAACIRSAFDSCQRGMVDLDLEPMESPYREYLERLKEMMDTSGLENIDSGKGGWVTKAEQFTDEEKHDLVNIIDELAYYFRAVTYESGD